jgi:hypothetical protein
MDDSELEQILKRLKRGEISIEEAAERINSLDVENLGFARIDHQRAHRCGLPEVILAEGKTAEQVAEIAEKIIARSGRVLITRLGAAAFEALKERLPDLQYNQLARTAARITQAPRKETGLLIVTAGTSDLPVAEEAAATSEALGYEPTRLYDVGVAGLHRLLRESDRLRAAKVVIVVAGMEGALPSVVGGLIDAPIIAVPTSVGYGAAFGGIAALLGMLNSCASGLVVVNIDNGFGAAVAAIKILKSGSRIRD